MGVVARVAGLCAALVVALVSAGAPSRPVFGAAEGGRALLASELRVAGQAAASAPVTWCGSGETPDNRLPQRDAVPSSTIRVLYAFPVDVPSRFGELAGAIVSDVAALDGWWRLQDPGRELRWDLYAFPGCGPGIDALDLGVLPLAREGTHYAGPTGYERLVSEVAPHLGQPEKALVYLDGAVIAPGVCGVSKMAARNGARYGVSVIALRSACRVDLGAGIATARIAAHELVHNLGAVSSKAPNACGDPTLGGHACDGPDDLMFPYASSDMRLADAVLDRGRDDYYGHEGEWWDVQDSAWLVHLPRRTLTVAITGPGSVASAPAVIACPGSCAATLDGDASLQLTALAHPGAEFHGWKGACKGEGTCRVAMTADVRVTAVFGALRAALSVRVRGGGRVTSTPSGLGCPGRCAVKFPRGTVVTLRARPLPGWVFRQWSSVCAARATCVQRMTGDRQVTATFVRKTSSP